MHLRSGAGFCFLSKELLGGHAPMNGNIKSEPLSDSFYEPLAREAKMPKAQLSKAPAVSYCENQLDILTKLAGRTGPNVQLNW